MQVSPPVSGGIRVRPLWPGDRQLVIRSPSCARSLTEPHMRFLRLVVFDPEITANTLAGTLLDLAEWIICTVPSAGVITLIVHSDVYLDVYSLGNLAQAAHDADPLGGRAMAVSIRGEGIEFPLAEGRHERVDWGQSVAAAQGSCPIFQIVWQGFPVNILLIDPATELAHDLVTGVDHTEIDIQLNDSLCDVFYHELTPRFTAVSAYATALDSSDTSIVHPIVLVRICMTGTGGGNAAADGTGDALASAHNTAATATDAAKSTIALAIDAAKFELAARRPL